MGRRARGSLTERLGRQKKGATLTCVQSVQGLEVSVCCLPTAVWHLRVAGLLDPTTVCFESRVSLLGHAPGRTLLAYLRWHWEGP